MVRSTPISLIWKCFVAFIFYAALLPFSFDLGTEGISARIAQLEFIPFWNIAKQTRWSQADLVQNIILFIPFGIFGFLSTRRVFPVVIYGFLLSTVVESLQLLTTGRIACASDIVANTFGAALGCVLVAAMLSVSKHSSNARTSFKKHRALNISRSLSNITMNYEHLYPAIVICTLCLITSFAPFDFSLEIGDLKRNAKFLLGEINSPQFSLGNHPLLFLRFTVLGLALFLVVSRSRRSLAKCLAATILFSAFCEFGQFFIGSRTASLTDFTVEVIGSFIGICLAQSYSSRRISNTTLVVCLFLGSAFSAACFLLNPFNLSTSYQPMALLPFKHYQQSNLLAALANIIEVVSIYFLVGFYVSYSRHFSDRKLTFVLLSIGVIVVLTEFSQSWIVGRIPDVTDIFLQLAGAVLGFKIGARGRMFANSLRSLAPASYIPVSGSPSLYRVRKTA